MDSFDFYIDGYKYNIRYYDLRYKGFSKKILVRESDYGENIFVYIGFYYDDGEKKFPFSERYGFRREFEKSKHSHELLLPGRDWIVLHGLDSRRWHDPDITIKNEIDCIVDNWIAKCNYRINRNKLMIFNLLNDLSLEQLIKLDLETNNINVKACARFLVEERMKGKVLVK